MAWGKYIILHKPECVIGEAAAHHGTPMLFHKLTEVIGVDDMRLHSVSGQSSRPKPTARAVELFSLNLRSESIHHQNASDTTPYRAALYRAASS